MSAIDLRRYREAYRHDKTHPHPPPNRQRIHVISPPGFFHPLGRQLFSTLFPPPASRPSPCRPITYMACCKVCCGCKQCGEGEEGKCCCGNECCQPGTYCCNAECVQPCSEAQEGDCKCSDACCYQGEFCCDGACVEACGEGDQGPCKCGSSCCAEGEYCCSGECQPHPCRENCDEFANWTLEVTFCGETLIWSSDPTKNNSPDGKILFFSKGAQEGACCTFGTGDHCPDSPDPNVRFTGPGMGAGGAYRINVAFAPELRMIEGKCTGSIIIDAVGPTAICDYDSCISFYVADIEDGRIVRIQKQSPYGSDWEIPSSCACDPEIQVTLDYNPLP